MTAAATWFLVFIGGQQWIGPLHEEGCKAAELALHGDGVVCRQATTMQACAVPNQPEVYMACPAFDFPKVTVKKP